MTEILQDLSSEEKKALRETEVPSWMDPMLATLTDRRFSDDDWIFERKLDGERCIAYRCGDRVRLCSRNKKVLNDTYPEIEEALQAIGPDTIVVDGEIVAFEDSVTSFSRLQDRIQIRDRARARTSGVEVFYYVFDLLYLEGYDTTAVPLRSRKSLLKQAIEYADPLRYTMHRNADGEAYYHEACEKGWEGIIAKYARGRYIHSRSKEWLKFKCVHRQEFVIGGYTEPEGSRIGFGALLLGYCEGDELVYAGRVGTGFDDETLTSLSERLQSLEQDRSPFAGSEAGGKGVHFVAPELVGEVGFTEWTGQGKLRHPRFEGLRRDKPPEEVVRERPKG